MITVSASGSAGYVSYHPEPIFATDCICIRSKNPEVIKTKYVYKYLHSIQMNLYELQRGNAQPHVYSRDLVRIKIPVPDLAIQQKIIAEMQILENQEKEIRNKINILEEKINQNLEKLILNQQKIKLNKVTQIFNGGTPSTKVMHYWNGDISWATLIDTKQKYLKSTKRKITKEGLKNSSAVLLPVNTVIFSSRATIGEVTITKIPVCTNQGYKNFVCDETKLNHEFLYYIFKKFKLDIENLSSGMIYKEINLAKIANFEIPLPLIALQNIFVDQCIEIENEISNAYGSIDLLKKQKSAVLSGYLYDA